MFWVVLDLILLLIILGELGILYASRDKGKEKPVGQEAAVTEAPVKEEIRISVTPTQAPAGQTLPNWHETESSIQEIIANSEETWEVYISSGNGEEVFEKSAGSNVRAGDIEYFFLAEKIHREAAEGRLPDTAEDSADRLLSDKDPEAYQELRNMLPEPAVTENGTRRISFDEDYPHTVWDMDEETPVAYTSAVDGANYLEAMVKKADSGDAYAQNEASCLERELYTGAVTPVLKEHAKRILELSSESGEGLETFVYVQWPGGRISKLGIMAADIADMETCRDKVRKIAEALLEYEKQQEGFGAE